MGYSGLATGTVDHAFLYTATSGMLYLNSLLDASGAGWTLTEALGLSDTGYITGYGTINGVTHGFLLTPTPDPRARAPRRAQRRRARPRTPPPTGPVA